MDKLYGIEKQGPDYYGSYKYRYYSLVNGARGGWCYKEDDAVKEGEAHQKIIERELSFHNILFRKNKYDK
jgi:hypothetical protein